VDVLRNLLFAPLVGGDVDQVDLIAIDIQRERDVGLGSLNQTRRALGLAPYSSFAQLTNDPILQANLETVYGDIDAVDLFIGGLAENHVRAAQVGPTFQAIIGRQFRALRTGDRFYWQNQPFDRTTAYLIGNSTLGSIIRRNTDTTSQQRNVFLAAATGHVKHHLPAGRINTHGRRGIPFMVR
jgi:peroxidase